MGLKIDEVRTSGPTARNYLWNCRIAKHGLDPLVNLRCTTTNVPYPVPDKMEIAVRGYTIPEAGATTWNPITFTVIENVSYEFQRQLWEWSIFEFDPESGVQVEADASPSNNAADLMIFMENLSRSTVINYTLIGAVLSAITFGDPGADKATALENTFEVSYAYAKQG